MKRQNGPHEASPASIAKTKTDIASVDLLQELKLHCKF
jgi:hypothetical protein